MIPLEARPLSPRLGWCAVLAAGCLSAAPVRGGASSEAGVAHGSGRGGGAAPVCIELRSEVAVPRAQVTLDDVAIVTTEDLPTLERLVVLPLGTVPWVGSAHLRRAALARWISTRTGLRPGQIAWRGSHEVSIRMASQQVAGDDIARRAEVALRSAAARERFRAEIVLREAPADVIVPAGQAALRVRAISRAALLARSVTVWVDAWVDGRFARTVPVAFGLDAFAPGYVAGRLQRAGEALDASVAEAREVEWRGRDVLPASAGSLEGMRLRLPVEAGTVLTRAHLEPVPLVARGGSATLRVSQGLVQLESRVEVLQDGWAGQVVPVKVPGARAAIRAKVTGPATVEVP